mmetsp:Transcript_2884/g.5293  ORF Transcript_2884/g.5293 Transcript_2884/m.5293 type:complete len:210 (-) Transcript_2884:371-1000(-)
MRAITSSLPRSGCCAGSTSSTGDTATLLQTRTSAAPWSRRSFWMKRCSIWRRCRHVARARPRPRRRCARQSRSRKPRCLRAWGTFSSSARLTSRSPTRRSDPRTSGSSARSTCWTPRRRKLDTPPVTAKIHPGYPRSSSRAMTWLRLRPRTFVCLPTCSTPLEPLSNRATGAVGGRARTCIAVRTGRTRSRRKSANSYTTMTRTLRGRS